jgi:aminoglycoside phosphotransferase (APT) family kinase protein
MSLKPDFDEDRFRAFLEARFGPAADYRLERIAGGQSNPTYFVTQGGRQMVLRKQPNGPLLKGAHAIDREYRVLAALHPAGVPVPRPVLFHETPDILGTPFYLMERVEGRVFSDGALPEVPAAARHALWMGLADALGALHRIRPDEVGLADYGRPGSYFERQLSRWSRQWQESTSDPIPELDQLGAWLAENLPPDDGAVSLAHGDYRMGNVIFHPTEPRVVAILDWELSTLGHPLADLGFCAMAWHTSPAEYGGILGLDLTALGLPAEAEFLARYAAANPSAAAPLTFHKAFALFRFAVIFVGIADRAKQGNASGADAAKIAPLARRFAIRGLEVINGRHPE